MGAAQAWSPAPDWAIYLLIGVILFGLLIAFASVGRALGGDKNWSLADALSEEADVSQLDANGTPVLVGGSVVTKTVLAGSASRLIAFVGMLAILAMFVGFGVFILFNFGKTGMLPAATGDVTKYLLGGVTLFAPYMVNKFASVFAPK